MWHGQEDFRFESCYGDKINSILLLNEGGEDERRARMTARILVWLFRDSRRMIKDGEVQGNVLGMLYLGACEVSE